MIRFVLLLLVLAAFPAPGARAQQTNAERMGALAVGCVVDRTTGHDPVRLTGPERLPFVRSALVASWQAGGMTVYDAGAEAADAVDVSLAVEDAGVRYERADDAMIRRSVRLNLRIAVTAADGRILSDDVCRATDEDLVPASSLESLANPAYPETVGEGPREGFFRRILHPVIVTAATAVGVFLFFSLRSRRADDGG